MTTTSAHHWINSLRLPMIIKKIMHDQRNDLRDIVDFACYDFPNYQCNNGKCHNITGVYSCRINETNIMNQALLIFLSSQPSSSSPQQAIHKTSAHPYNYFSCRNKHCTQLAPFDNVTGTPSNTQAPHRWGPRGRVTRPS